MPLVRAAYESAITAHWGAQTRDGFAAFLNEDIRQRRNHVRAMGDAASAVFREAATTVTGIDFASLPTSASAKQFNDVCQDLAPGGTDAYVIYRQMSHLSHASVLVADQYLEEIDHKPGIALRLEPKEPDGRPWTHLLVASLVWAGRAIEYLDKHHRRRAQLLSTARAIGVAPHLHLSDRAVVREAGGP